MTARDEMRDQIVHDAWSAGFPSWRLSTFVRFVSDWFARNKANFGLFVSWPTGGRDDPLGVRIGVFTADSPTRSIVVGWARLRSRDLRRLVDEGRVVRVRVFGWLQIARDVDAQLAASALESVRVIGVSRVPRPIRRQLAA